MISTRDLMLTIIDMVDKTHEYTSPRSVILTIWCTWSICRCFFAVRNEVRIVIAFIWRKNFCVSSEHKHLCSRSLWHPKNAFWRFSFARHLEITSASKSRDILCFMGSCIGHKMDIEHSNNNYCCPPCCLRPTPERSCGWGSWYCLEPWRDYWKRNFGRKGDSD